MTQTAAPKSRIFTFDEYLTYDDGTDTRYEFVNGELVSVPPATHLHRRIAQFLEAVFLSEIARLKYEWETGRGDTGVRTKGSRRDITRLPDVVVFDSQIIEDPTGVAILLEPPKLVVEVVSPGEINRKRDYEQKPREYQRLGIPEYWIVDPQRQIVTLLTLFEGLYEETEYQENDPIPCQTFQHLNLPAFQVLSGKTN